jgi:hypothetical protein
MKLLLLIKILALLVVNSYADSMGVKYFDDKEKLTRSGAWEFINQLCVTSLGVCERDKM